MHLAIIIPAYNEEKVIRDVVRGLPKKLSGIDKISVVAVDDGSTDNSVSKIAKTRAILISHPLNLGTGSATITGLETAKKLKADIAVTFDGDGQHDPSDIAPVIKPILKGKADIVIGSRLKNPRGMPFARIIGNKFLNLATFLLSGLWTSDSQSGFKGLSKRALKKLELTSPGFEYCSEVFIEARRKRLKITEVPIKVIYSRYSRIKGQSIANGINIISKLILKRVNPVTSRGTPNPVKRPRGSRCGPAAKPRGVQSNGVKS